MKDHAPIIVAIDFSTSSAPLLTHGTKLASALGCTLIVAHVLNESRLLNWVKATGREASVEGRLKEVAPLLRESVEHHCSGVDTEIDIRVGRPRKVLETMIEEHQADLLIMGAHDHPGKTLGSVSRYCARCSPSDVLVIRDWQGGFFKRIAVCVDLQSPSTVGMERAIALARVHHASLEIIHVIFPPNIDPWGRAIAAPMQGDHNYESVVRDRARNQLDELLDPFSSDLDKIEWSSQVLESQSPAAVIAAHVDAARIDLTVVGSHDSSWVFDTMLGTTTEHLLNDSNSSILIVRNSRLGES